MNTSLDYQNWYEWNCAQVVPKQIIDLSDYQTYEDDETPEGEPEGCCSGCMYCLGLSWKDFM